MTASRCASGPLRPTVPRGPVLRALTGLWASVAFSPPVSPPQDIAKDVPRGEESLRRLEAQAVGVIQNTSPLGAEKITRDLEEMRRVLEKLCDLCEEEEGRLRGLLASTGAFEQRRAQLEAELGEFRKGLWRLAEEGLQPAAKAGTEDELVARWRLYSVSHAVQAAWGVAPWSLPWQGEDHGEP